jgi:hypothetical protein
MKWLTLAVLVFGCDTTRCQEQHCGGTHYRFCQQAGGGCYYQTSDDQVFVCNNCSDCVAAKQSVDGWCGFAPSDPTQPAPGVTCTSTLCPLGSGRYQFCTRDKAAGCYYATSDSFTFACASCSDCTQAVQGLTNWCSAQAPPSTPDLAQPDCNTCLDTAQQSGGTCSSGIDQCRNDAACTSYVTCLNGCADATCENNCRNSASAGAVSQVNAIDACLCGACSICGC